MRDLIFRVAACLVLAGLMSGCGDNGPGPQGVNFNNVSSASVVIGQPDFASGAPNQGGVPAANTLRYPFGNPIVVGGMLYLPDTENNRILVYNSVPTTNNPLADFVLGQPDFSSSAIGDSATSLNYPTTLKYYNGKMIAGDLLNNRVLIWNSVPRTAGVPADVVVGQAGFGVSSAATTQTRMWNPSDIEVVNGKLIVADRNNNRVLIWNTLPTTNGAPADLVLGQADFTSGAANAGNPTPTAGTLYMPFGVCSDGTRLLVTEHGNHRVLVWNTFPTVNGAPADLVLGQPDFTHNARNNGHPGPDAASMFSPTYITSNGTQLFVADTYNHRILVWNTFPTMNFQPADKVMGQVDFTHGALNGGNPLPSSKTLYLPAGLYLYGSKLFVSDYRNSRCLIFQGR